jgi:hypothetical protein
VASDRQVAANRRNATKSTGPRTTMGKRRSRMNALQHGLAAEVLVPSLEDADEYRTFCSLIAGDFDPQSATEQQLIARLASLLWRLRRVALIETGLFEIQGRILRTRRQHILGDVPATNIAIFQRLLPDGPGISTPVVADNQIGTPQVANAAVEGRPHRRSDLATAFLRLCNLDNDVVDRLGRYESTLWRQAVQILVLLKAKRRLGAR